MKLVLPVVLMCLAGAACDTRTCDNAIDCKEEEDEADDREVKRNKLTETMEKGEYLEDKVDRLTSMVGHLTSMEGHLTSMVGHLTSMVGHLTSKVDTLLSQVAAPPVYGDCAAAKAFGQTTSGVYTLGSLPSGVQVYCDMDTDGGGWTVIQRRQDGSVPFNRTWEEYKQGFGDNNGEYWLGNENIHLLTQQKSYTLRIDMSDWEGESRFAVYSTFRVAGESDGYRLTIDGYSGDAGDTMTGSPSNNGQKFSTVDRDNDASSSDHCSQDWGGEGGWWFSVCGGSNLNGRYLGNCGNCQGAQGVVWYHWKGNWYSMKSVSMKIRP